MPKSSGLGKGLMPGQPGSRLPDPTLIPPGTVRYAPLTWSQEVIWFEHETIPRNQRQRLNMHLVVEVPDNITTPRIHEAIRTVFSRHEALRTILVQSANVLPLQAVQREIKVEIRNAAPDVDLDLFIAQLRDEPFDLDAGFPIRLGMAAKRDGGALLVFVLHHIAADAWSLSVIEADFLTALSA